MLRNLRNLDQPGIEQLSIGVGGLVAVGFGLYALVFPVIGWDYVTDGHASNVESTAMTVALILALTAVIAAELVGAAALIRMSVDGVWPGRRFLLGWPAAVIAVVTSASAPALSLLL
jgi:hypothetical protein